MDDRWRSAMERTRREKEAELAESREQMVSSGILTRPVEVHLSAGSVAPDSMRLIFGDALIDSINVQAPVPNGVQRSFGEIPVEDLRM